jgi:hypothetical protein
VCAAGVGLFWRGCLRVRWGRAWLGLRPAGVPIGWGACMRDGRLMAGRLIGGADDLGR